MPIARKQHKTAIETPSRFPFFLWKTTQKASQMWVFPSCRVVMCQNDVIFRLNVWVLNIDLETVGPTVLPNLLALLGETGAEKILGWRIYQVSWEEDCPLYIYIWFFSSETFWFLLSFCFDLCMDLFFSPTAECYGVFAQYWFRCVLGEPRFRGFKGFGFRGWAANLGC